MIENGFDIIEVIIKMHEETLRRLYAGFDPKCFYTGLYNPRRSLTLKEFTKDMNVEVGSLRLEVPTVQLPPPPHTDYAGQEETFLFQAGVNGFLHADFIPEQEVTISFQADVGVNPEITTAQVAARQEFARPPENQQQRGMIE